MTAQPVNEPVPAIPAFEGKPVAAAKLKITSTLALDVGDQVLRMDDIVRVVVDARVSAIHHNENAKGELERVQTAKALAVEIVPWNPDDPSDTGVFRV